MLSQFNHYAVFLTKKLTNHARLYSNFGALSGVSLNAENSLSWSLDKRYYILAGEL